MIIMGKREGECEFLREKTVFWQDIERLEGIIPWGPGFRKIREMPNRHLSTYRNMLIGRE